LFDRKPTSRRPDLPSGRPSRTAKVKDGRRSPPKVARSLLDRSEHDGTTTTAEHPKKIACATSRYLMAVAGVPAPGVELGIAGSVMVMGSRDRLRWLTAPSSPTIEAPPCRHDGNHPTAASFAG
jgi:hypothetical protein